MISSDHLEPGQTGRIKASIDTTGKTGRLEKYLTVYSNDKDNPALTLSIAVEILQK